MFTGLQRLEQVSQSDCFKRSGCFFSFSDVSFFSFFLHSFFVAFHVPPFKCAHMRLHTCAHMHTHSYIMEVVLAETEDVEEKARSLFVAQQLCSMLALCDLTDEYGR